LDASTHGHRNRDCHHFPCDPWPNTWARLSTAFSEFLGWLAAASFNGFAQLLKNHRELRQNCHIGNPALDVMSRRTAQKSMSSGHCPGVPRAPFPEFRGPATGPKADECSSNIALPPTHRILHRNAVLHVCHAIEF